MFNDEFYKTIKGIQEANKVVTNALKNFYENTIKPLEKTLDSFYNNLRTINPNYVSKEKQEEYKQLYEGWAETYGWCIPLNAPFFIHPVFDDNDEADNYMLSFINDEEICNDMYDLLHISHISKEDIDELMNNYHNKHYKSCILLIFTFIDSIIMQSQKINKKTRRNEKSFCTSANQITDDSRYDKLLCFTCRYYSTIKCIEKIYEDGKDFSLKTDVINRNFVMHGMIKRPITRIDCIKIFVLLENLCYFVYENEELKKIYDSFDYII